MNSMAILHQTFLEKGFAVLNDLAPEEDALRMRKKFENSDYDHIYQDRAKHFSHVFKPNPDMTDIGFPTHDEHYMAKFSRSNSLERDEEILNFVDTHIKQAVNAISGKVIKTYSLRCYKMDRLDMVRMHIDDYVADVGFIYYCNKRWSCDWGGALHATDGSSVLTVLPHFNQLVVVNHAKRIPHWVGQISDYAKESRLMIIGFSEKS